MSRVSSRVFPEAASFAARNASLRASCRSCDSRCDRSQCSRAPGHGSSGSSRQLRSNSAPGHAHNSCQTVSDTGIRPANVHDAWQGQRHRMIVDSRRRRILAVRIAAPMCPQSLCEPSKHTSDLPRDSEPGRPSDTWNLPPAFSTLPASVDQALSQPGTEPNSGQLPLPVAGKGAT